MTEGPVRDLTQLRDQFTTLRNAIAVNDIAAVEAATAHLRASLTTLSTTATLPADAHALVRDVMTLCDHVGDTLAARLNAFDMVIDALRADNGTTP